MSIIGRETLIVFADGLELICFKTTSGLNVGAKKVKLCNDKIIM